VNGAEMRAALSELGEKLQSEGVAARVFLVGGAVMVLAFESRESSDDLDASVYPPEEVLRMAREVGRRRGLEPDWLNDAAKVYIPIAKEPDWQLLGTYGALEVLRADESTMLAMKLRASRGMRDRGDIEYLIRRCGFATEEDVLAMYNDFFPEDPLPNRAMPLIRSALARRAEESLSGGLSPSVSADPPSAPADSPTRNAPMWVRSTRGKYAHRLSRQDGSEVLTICGDRLSVAAVVMSTTPGRSICRRCNERSSQASNPDLPTRRQT
jgi:hypothetical protein